MGEPKKLMVKYSIEGEDGSRDLFNGFIPVEILPKTHIMNIHGTLQMVIDCESCLMFKSGTKFIMEIK